MRFASVLLASRCEVGGLMTPESVQAWVAVVGGLGAALLGLVKYFNYRSKRDRLAEVGASFVLTIESLASDNATSRMAGAVLLRRFFDRHTEQGAVGRPYVREAIEVMAGMLREEQLPHVQKVLADGLRYARQLAGADLQNCDLRNAYLGIKAGDKEPVDLCTRGSLCRPATGHPSRASLRWRRSSWRQH